MKKLSLLGAMCVTMMGAGLCLPALAQDSALPDNVTINATTAVPADMENDAALSNEEVEKALANAIRQSLNEQEQTDQEVTGEDEDEPKKKYRYEKKDGPFSARELPKKTFNNIPYPY